MGDIVIRSYRPSDEAAVQEITYRTGFKGEDLTGRDYIDDKRLFFLIFIYYYTRYEPQHFFVAVDTRDAAVVGFIGGTTDTAAQERNFQRKVVWRIAARALLFTSWRYPGTFRTVLDMRSVADGFQDHAGAMSAVRARYPAHLHINLLPEYQGMGFGTRLMEHFEAHLICQGVTGVHLQTTSQNRKAVPFYRKLGYTLVDRAKAASHPLFGDLEILTFAKTLPPAREVAQA